MDKTLQCPWKRGGAPRLFLHRKVQWRPAISIVVPYCGLTNYIGRIPYKVTPKRSDNGEYR